MTARRPRRTTTAPRGYLDALGLARAPFPPTPDADGYFMTEALEGDLAEAAHCLLARKGFVLLTGDVGRGKTTFVRRLVAMVQDEGAAVSLVFNTFLQGPELLSAVLRDFGLKPGTDAADDIHRLNRFLVRQWHAGVTCVLVIDDAQNLSLESLELLRLLSNLESGQEKLLQIVLAGQPELEQALAAHAIRQLTSRVVKHVRLGDLDAADTASYVEFRLAQAGNDGRIALTRSAYAALHRSSRGNPRRIHLIMDRCLYGVVARGRPVVDRALVARAASEAGFAGARSRGWRIAAAAIALTTTGLATAAGFGLASRWSSPSPSIPVPVAASPDARVAPSSAPESTNVRR